MIDVHIPKMGMSTVEVEILAVMVEVGQQVGAEDSVVEVEGDKATFEVEAGTAGTVAEILVSEGQECSVGDVVVRIAEPLGQGPRVPSEELAMEAEPLARLPRARSSSGMAPNER
jgi:pyruvate/2-oxoglutarate dehydrogenase complex dihydrolipoamide acyltransferase (E2) component